MLESRDNAETYSRNEYWIVAYLYKYVSKTPNLSRTHDIEASFTLLFTTNPYISRGLN